MIVAAFVVLAGAGAVLRAAAAVALDRPGRPAGTLAVNVGGAFAAGALVGAGPDVVTTVGVGGLGAFTTFSALAVQTVELPRWRGVAYLAVTLVAGTTAAWVGLRL